MHSVMCVRATACSFPSISLIYLSRNRAVDDPYIQIRLHNWKDSMAFLFGLCFYVGRQQAGLFIVNVIGSGACVTVMVVRHE